jgi:phage terminase large subunit GpA-like protein
MIAPTDFQAQLHARASQLLAPRELPDIVDFLEGRARDRTGAPIPPLQLIDKDADYRGPFTTDNCPDLREILRSAVSPDIESTVIVGPTQSFKTTALLGVAAYTIAVDFGPLGWVMPTEPLARAFSSKRVQPCVDNTPWLAALKPADPDAYKHLELGFRTCTVRFAGSNSPTNLASFSYKRVIGDETDKFPQRLRNEAGTLDLLLQRTGQYTRHNHLFASTPTVPHGTIWQAALRGDCRRYHVPCPHCSKPFVQSFALLRWDESAKNANNTWDFARVARSAHLQCPHCSREIFENHRRDMLHAGAAPDAALHGYGWIPDPIDVADQRRADYELIADPRCRSYFRSCFNVIHPNRTFARIAEKHLQAGKDPSKRQNFTNSELGEVFEELGETVEAKVLYDRREDYLDESPTPLLPEDVRVLVAAADVQASPARIEYEIIGYGADYESWGIQYGIIEKRGTWQKTFDELDRILLTPWMLPVGPGAHLPLVPAAVAIDTGHETEEVYKYVRRCQPRRVYAVKGSSEGYGQALVSRPQKSGVKQVTLYQIGTVTAKMEILSRLRVTDAGPGCTHFPKNPKRGYDHEYFRQLTAESAVTRWKAGRKEIKFIKPAGRRNEALDIRCYARAALELLNPAIDKLSAKIADQAAQLELPTPASGNSHHEDENKNPEPRANEVALQPDVPAITPDVSREISIDQPITKAALINADNHPPRVPVASDAPADPLPAEPVPNSYELIATPHPEAKPRPEKQKIFRPRRSSWATRW